MFASKLIDPSLKGVVWLETNRERAVERPALDDDIETDLVVVGAGYLGLTAALRAAENGTRAVILESGVVGAGASGRNGGYAVPHFPGALLPSAVEQRLGPKKGRALVELVANGPDRVGDLVRTHGIESDFQQNGWVQLAHSPASLAKVKAVHEEWKALGARTEWLDADGVRREIGSPTYLGGWRNLAGAVLNPYAHALGLARAAEAAGVRILERTSVTTVEQVEAGRVTVRSASASGNHVVRASKVLVATNGYSDALTSGLAASVINLRLYHCATQPLPEAVLRSILPKKDCTGDLRKSGGFARLDVAGRLISGGAVFAAARDVRAYGLAHARRRITDLFPQLKDVPLEFGHYWEGYCAITDSFLPNLQRLKPDVYSVIGFSTRGVSLTQNVGRLMGDFLSERIGVDDVPLEFVDGVRKIAFQGFKTAVGRQIFPIYQIKDRLRLT